MAVKSPEYIIAIGASAGGIDELKQFFDYTPLDNSAYVIVQHLSPNFKSRMMELLKKHSILKVTEAKENMPIQVNNVYLIPSSKFMTLQKGRLHLTDKKNVKTPHLTINTFFNSLAADKKEKSIGVILSGFGADGTEGAQAIYNEGGLILAREPGTTAFGSMPESVIAAGIVSFVLEPELMPKAINNYVKNNGMDFARDIIPANDEEKVNEIIELIKDRLPMDFTEYKPSTLTRRIKRRASINNHKDLDSYIAFCKTNKEEVEALAKDFLISVTSFFRDKEAYAFMERKVIPQIISNNVEGDQIKCWVAGCATGEEAYSLAILLKEQLTGSKKNCQVKIFATDIDAVALDFAGKGKYPERIAKDISPKRLEAYFTRAGNSYVIKPVIRKMLIFAKHDLVKNPPYCNMDLISCRNLLIYLTPPLQKKIHHMLLFGLKREGFLFLGSSENAQPINNSLELLNKKWKIYKNIRSNRNSYPEAFTLPDIDTRISKMPGKLKDNYKSALEDLNEAISNEIMDELGYMLICVDDKNQVFKSYGDLNKYLLQKNFNLNLVDLLPGNLSLAYKTVAKKALKENDKVGMGGIRIVNTHGRDLDVRLMVKPFLMKTGQKILTVLFSEEKQSLAKSDREETYNEKFVLDNYTKNLEEELKDLKIELDKTNEKLDASNENLQSYNEELLSANEEMQSTNEEMQSVNEELHTINSDYQAKNKELMEMNDDLNNYFRSNVNGQLFVNNDLLLMKFSPATVAHINLLESDIGRPITNISTNIKFSSIEKDIKEVIKTGNVINKEIESTNGKWYQLTTMPYRHLDEKKIHGGIMTFTDITDLKKAQLELDKKNKKLLQLLKVNDDLDNFIHMASHDLLGPLTSLQAGVSVMNEYELNDPALKTVIMAINSSVKNFTGLIRDMSVISEIESGKLSTENVNIAALIEEIKLSIRDKIDESHADIKTDLKVPDIWFSKKNFKSILYNIINNAIKFKNKNKSPVITISSFMKNSNIYLSVKDNGIGIPAKETENIFKLHERLNKQVEGHGMGLFLIKKIIDASGGSIKAESTPGKGTTFTICLQMQGGGKKLKLPVRIARGNAKS